VKKLVQIIRSWFILGLTAKQMYPISLAICLIVIVSLVAMNITSNSNSVNQTEPYKETTNLPALQQIRQQYSDLRTEHIKLQGEYVALQFAYESAKQNADNINSLIQKLSQSSDTNAKQVSDLQAELTQVKSEIPNIRVALRIATDERAIFEKRFLQSQYDNTLLADRIEQGQQIHQDLLDRMAEVTGRTDNTTTSNLTAEKRANFYEMWDLWIETLSESE